MTDERRHYERLISNGPVEIRAFNGKVHSGIYSHLDDLLSALRQADKAGMNTYTTINQFTSPDRAFGKYSNAVADADIDRIHTIFFDFDPIEKPAPEQYRLDALAQAMALDDFLAGMGWSKPTIADSGNGSHLLYTVDMPVTDLTGLYAGLKRFNSDTVGFDVAVKNPARICRAYGTNNIKAGRRSSCEFSDEVTATQTVLDTIKALSPKQTPRKTTALSSPPEFDEIRDALSCIPSDLDYESWYQVGMALKAELGESGLSLFDQWSSSYQGYKPGEIRQKWRSFKRNGISIKTLFMLARQHGYTGIKYTPKPVDRAEIKAQIEAHTERHKLAALKAQERWEKAVKPKTHPYLSEKKITAFGARADSGNLLIPLRIGQVLWSLLTIAENGKALFQKGGKVAGTYCAIGKLTPSLWVCDDYASACTIHKITGMGVIYAPHMDKVAIHFRQQHKNIRLMIATADVEAGHKAMKAGMATKLVYPDEGTDWNGYFQQFGQDKTFEELSK